MQLRKLAPAGFLLISTACSNQTQDSHKPIGPQIKFQQPPAGQSKLSKAENRLNQLLQARLDLMSDVALWKWQEKQPIEDLKRERLVLDRVAELAEKQSVCADEARLFFNPKSTLPKRFKSSFMKHGVILHLPHSNRFARISS